MSLSTLLALLLLSGGAGSGSGSILHPADGPDADVRILVDSEKVRFQITLNLAFVDEIISVAREDESALHPVEYEWVRGALFDYFRDTNGVEIDGVEVVPVDQGFEVFEPDLSLLPLFPRTGRRGLLKVLLLLDYPVKARPTQVKMYWGAYPPDLAVGDELYMPSVQILARLFAYGLESEVKFVEEEPEVTWHDSGRSAADLFLEVPQATAPAVWRVPIFALATGSLAVFALLLALRRGSRGRRQPLLAMAGLLLGAAVWQRDLLPLEINAPFGQDGALPTAEEARSIFEPLHANIYRAFDYTAPSDIYDALAQSVDGPLLENLYNQVYRGLIMQDQGGAVSRVTEVRPLQIEVESVGVVPSDGRVGFDVNARWQVDGRVTHFGHSHERTNEYHARYNVVLATEGWRIGGTQMLAQQRVSATPGGGG